MLSHEKKFIYIQIPKCAGTSIFKFLKKNANALGWQKEPGLKYRLRTEGLAKTINMHPEYYKFTFVRNPFARFISLWRHSERNREKALPGAGQDYGYRPTKLNLKQYAHLIKKGDESQLSGFDLYHSKKQTDFILDYNKSHFFFSETYIG